MGYKIDKEQSGRLDALKVLMCLFVLMIHAFSDDYADIGWGGLGTLYQITFVISQVICDCAVPVFILISSMLLYAKPFRWWENVKKKCRSLLVPYLIFNSLWVVMMLLKHLLGKGTGEDVVFASYGLFDWLDCYLGLTGDYKPLLTSLWYVRDLFLLNLLAIPLKKLIDLLPVPTLIVTLVIWLGGISIPGIQDYALPFFVFGYYLVKYQICFKDLDRKLPWYPVLAAYVALAVLVVAQQRQVQVIHRSFLLVAVVFWILASRRLVRFEKPIRLLLPASFFLYLGHRFVYAVIQLVAEGSLKLYLCTYPVKPVLAVAVLLAVFYLLRRFLPTVLAVMIGGRVPQKRKEGSRS